MSITLVTLTVFSNLAGPALAADIRRLLARPVFSHLVLFSDVAGEQLAILPVGEGERYLRLEQLDGMEIEGLRPLCAFPAQGECSGAEQKTDRSGAAEARFLAREKELVRKEESLLAREEYLAECEQRMAEVGQSLAEREAMVDHREAMVLEKEREFFRRGGEAVRKPQAQVLEARIGEA